MINIRSLIFITLFTITFIVCGLGIALSTLYVTRVLPTQLVEAESINSLPIIVGRSDALFEAIVVNDDVELNKSRNNYVKFDCQIANVRIVYGSSDTFSSVLGKYIEILNGFNWQLNYDISGGAFKNKSNTASIIILEGDTKKQVIDVNQSYKSLYTLSFTYVEPNISFCLG